MPPWWALLPDAGPRLRSLAAIIGACYDASLPAIASGWPGSK